MKESSKWWGILLVSVSCVWLSTYSAREASVVGREVLAHQEVMLAEQKSIRAAIERIDLKLEERRDNQAALPKVGHPIEAAPVENVEAIGRSDVLARAQASGAGSDIGPDAAGLESQSINIDEAARVYESISEGVENFKERIIAYRETLNEEEMAEFEERRNNALDAIIANAEFADQFSPEELKEIRQSLSKDESLRFFTSAVEEGVLGQMLLEAEHTGSGDVWHGIEIQDRNE